MTDVYEALAAPVRRTILDELRERDGQTLFEICARLTMKHGLGLSRQAISQHLDVLEDAGLIHTRREGRYKFHDLDTAPLRAIVERWPTPQGKRRIADGAADQPDERDGGRPAESAGLLHERAGLRKED